MLWRRGDNRSGKLRFEGTQHLRSCFCFIIFSLLLFLFAPLSLFGAEEEIIFRGQSVFVEGAEVQWIGDPTAGDAELVLIYKNTEGKNTLRTVNAVEARVLAVGGGAGGTVRSAEYTDHPGGGGGGAGELVDRTGVSFAEQSTFEILVGAGGLPQGDSKKSKPGLNGQPSSIRNTVGDWQLLVKGGGGGGGESDGAEGASGGGASDEYLDDDEETIKHNPGSSSCNESDGQGHAGGTSQTRYAGGGGGAGEAGGKATTSKGGKGGDGIESDITGEAKYYAGGGGGGQTANSTAGTEGAGGAGGGGKGGKSSNTDTSLPDPGEANTGGGGGGGGRYKPGAAGGSGIVIIRITYIEIPMVWKPIPVTGGGNSGVIFVDKDAAVTTLGDDLLIAYSNTTARGALSFKVTDDMDEEMRERYKDNPPIWAMARVLLVGGGGGGGLITVHTQGSGGGGGAGGVVQGKDILFDNLDTYSVSVGAGGKGGAENEAEGGDGKPTSLKKGDAFVVDEALGGGGGGAHGNGRAGASGGGGSRTITAQDGGAGTAGQGNPGGNAVAGAFLGAGGGGAGSRGGDANNSIVIAGGKGGDGIENDITGVGVWYAAGGGGAYNSDSSIGQKYPGGVGGGDGKGGHIIGGYGSSTDGGIATPATSGADGTGSGGGGGASHDGAAETAGDGGSGVVIIRLSRFVVKNVPVPEEKTFTYDGNAHTGVVEFFTYDIKPSADPTRQAVATNADNYIVTVTISDTMPPSVEWGDATGGRAPRRIPWHIRQKVVDVPTWGTEQTTRTDYFTFGNKAQSDEEEKLAIDKNKWLLKKDRAGYPGETCATKNDEGTELPYCTLTGHRETNAGSYQFTATLVTTDPQGNFATNFVWRTPSTMEAQNVDWEIEQAENAITSLALADWQEGTTNKVPTSEWKWRKVMEKYPDSYPRKDVVMYQWRPEGGLWNDDVKPLEELVFPTEAGVYELRAYICEDSNHTADNQYGNWGWAERTTRFCIWRHPSKTLADWMELTFSYSSSRYITVNLRDVERTATGAVNTGYPGFRYADVIGDGNLAEIRFVAISNLTDVAACDKDNPLAADELLPFKAQTWNRSGTSEIHVMMPPKSATKIRMYWRRRPGVSVVLADKLASEVTKTSGNLATGRLVNQLQRIEDGVDVRAWVNYWTTEPTVTRYVELGKLKVSDVKAGVLKDGTVVTTYWKMPQKQVVNFNDVSTNVGPYAVNFTLKELEDGTSAYPGPHVYFDGDRTKDLEIYKDRPQPIDPTGAGTNLRVLLANDDTEGRESGNAVTNQSYAAWYHANHVEPPTVMTNVLKSSVEVMTNNLQQGTEHLLTNALGKVLWKLNSVYLGNMMTADTNEAAKVLLTNQYSLPWSATGAQRDRRQVGQMVLRNLGGDPADRDDDALGACIRSPWYTNGFNTVYFDAVNAYKTNSAAFRLQVEVSTNTFDNLTPTARSNVVWTCIRDLKQLKYTGSSFTNSTTVTDGKIELAVNDTGSTVTGLNRFYRIIAPIPAEYARTPCRFRIRRVAMLGEESEENVDDWHGFIVVDNVIASWPTEVVSCGTGGSYDPRKAGKQVLGWESAFSVDYPSAKEANLYVRASYAGTPDVVTSARCHYRWRYLDAAFSPERIRVNDEENFATVYLDPAEGFKSIAPLDLEKLGGGAGDLEYWFDLTAVTPFYEYCDYSGLSIAKPTGDYTENPEKGVPGRRSESEGRLPSRGTDWFVRLRDGASGYESFRAYFTYTLRDEYGMTRPGSQEVDLFLSEDHVWRGYVKTSKEMAGRPANYRLESLRPETPGSPAPNLVKTHLVASEDLSRPEDVPGSPILREAASSNETAAVFVDASTGHLMLQLDDRSMSLTVSHADYQDFNGWSDAVSAEDPPLFTGSSIEGPKKRGVSSKTVRLTEAFDRWQDTPETKDEWKLDFGTATIDDGKHAGYRPFETATFDAWTMNNGMWVARFYHPTDATSRSQSGLAVELFGAQNGNAQILNPVGNPRGVGEVRYAARVAQAIDSEAFVLSEEESPVAMKDYTFITRATFDTAKNLNFAGNASLSLVACYSQNTRTGYGFYEARWEQLKGDYDTASKTFTKPTLRSQRLCLYRWMKGAGGDLEPELLGAITNAVFDIPQTDGLKGKYMPFFISTVTDSAGKTTVAAGVLRTNGGIAAGEALSGKWMCVAYVDNKAGHPTAGSYGLLSSNCEGVFLRPTVRSGHATVSDAKTTAGVFQQLDNKTVTFAGEEQPCNHFGEIPEWWYWTLDGERMTDFYSEGEFSGGTGGSTDYWGVRALTPRATLKLQLCPKGKDEWTDFGAGKTVTGFGTNLKAGEEGSFVVRDVADKLIRLTASSSPLTDVVLTGAEFTQWRGDSYGDPNGDTTGFAVGERAYGYPSNIVFTSGVIVPNETKGFAHKVLLSAKRTPAGQAASVRSPFFDGEANWDGSRRGEGLGMIAFSYENAQTNADVLVQIATNGVPRGADVTDITKSVDTNVWTTVARFDFSKCSALERRRGGYTVYLGLHGVVGLMRVVLNPELVERVQGNKVSDTTAFGEIEITKLVCRDEPDVEPADWWGWNVRTVADVENGVDDFRRTYLPDGDPDAEASGMPIALNCGVTTNFNVLAEDADDLKHHMPFVQTPTFTNNIVGEVSFRARRYDNGDGAQYAEVELYGAYSGKEDDDAQWVPLQQFIVSNTTYEAYSFRAAGTFSAFRLAVTGVKGVLYPGVPRAYDPAVRVLVDEVSVFEAVNPEMGFRYVYPFRDGMDETAACTNVVDASGTALPDAQPLCGEGWTVQAEILKTKLPDEIDMTVHPPRVIFHWFFGNYPWGYGKWRAMSKSEGHEQAELALADGETMVFRGSLPKARAAVVAATMDAPTVVQYSADVIYHTVAGLELTNSLVRNAATTWVRPSWYAPVDYNAGKPLCSAYTILDSIAPHRAWINEVNLWDGRDSGTFAEYADTNQYIEVAAPELQSLEGWRIDYISNDKTVNTLVRFTGFDSGDGYAPPTKDLKKVPAERMNEYRTNDYVFLAVQSPKTRSSKTWASVPGAIDGTWRDFNGLGGILDQKEPIAIRLIRPSQVVEHEIVIEGTNRWESGRHPDRDNPTNWIAQVEQNVLERKSNLFYVGNEDPNSDRQSIGVVRNTGAVSNDWKNLMVQTPGRVNEGQIVPFGYVLYSNGDYMLVRARIGATGHILQTVAGETETANEVTLMIKKGGEGTNITYRVADWWETAFVTANGSIVPESVGKRGTWTLKNVGAGMSNDLTVVATAQPMTELREKYGLTEDNRYTPAVMDWLEGKKNLFGEEFEHPGEIHLAEFRTPITETYITNLDLTAMYWLDIDPTVSNTWLKGGIVNSRHGGIHPIVLDNPPPAVTNFRMGVHMEITNLQSGVAYAPYVLRGLAPGQTSADYAGNWDSVTFKITGDIQIGDPAYAGRERWVPLRWFVFKPKPGATSRVGASASFGDDFSATVDIWDPRNEASAIYTQGWSAFPDAPIFYRWAMDDRNAPVTIETLRPESTYSE